MRPNDQLAKGSLHMSIRFKLKNLLITLAFPAVMFLVMELI